MFSDEESRLSQKDQEIHGEVLSSDQLAFLRLPHIAVLATVAPHGEPHAVPMWYVTDGSGVLMVTRRESQKLRNLEHMPRATVVVDHRTRPYYAMMVRCEAEISSENVNLIRSKVAARYLGEPALSTYLESRRDSDSVVVRLEPIALAIYGKGPPA